MTKILMISSDEPNTGKTTLAINLICYLLHAGYGVKCIDLLGKQGTNSISSILRDRNRAGLLTTDTLPIEDLAECIVHAGAASENEDFVIIDAPSFTTSLDVASLYSYVDSLIITANSLLPKPLSNEYAQIIWEQKMTKIAREHRKIDWIVLRSRFLYTDLTELQDDQELLPYKLLHGLSEKNIHNTLISKSLTVADCDKYEMTMDHVIARCEMRKIANSIVGYRTTMNHAQVQL